nr:patatin-like phospholipase family protein [Naasia lichenicola]
MPIDAASRTPRRRERALVLGGGGSAGNAWLIGVLAGLSDAGLDVTDADLIIGTSAGATAAAQISGASLANLLADIVSASPPHAAPARPAGGSRAADRVAEQMRRTGDIIAASADAADMRRRMGAAAIGLATAAEGSGPRWRSMVAPRLPRHDWSERPMLITAVDAETGEPTVFDRSSGVELVDAVAASTSSGTAYPIGGHWYIDGGYRASAKNADLAAGSARVLVLSPFGGAARTPAEWGLHLAHQVDALRAGGSRVETIVPDDAGRAAFGDNAMDPSSRPPAARAGFAQGKGLAERLTAFWS